MSEEVRIRIILQVTRCPPEGRRGWRCSCAWPLTLLLTSYLAPRLTGSVQVLGILPRMAPETLDWSLRGQIPSIRSLVLQLKSLGGWSKEDKKNGIPSQKTTIQLILVIIIYLLKRKLSKCGDKLTISSVSCPGKFHRRVTLSYQTS